LLDRSRRYANGGELTTLLERRLSDRFGLPPGQMVLTASGTAGLVASTLASAGRARQDKPLCLCPGYMFVAGALAAEQCGYQPYFVDVDPLDWSLKPERMIGHPQIARTGVILAASPYGRSVPYAAWDEVARRTGVPVVIDAAAGVETFADAAAKTLSRTPLIFSFHATKAFACGEGGLAVSADPALLRGVCAAVNFGFDGARETSGPGFNGKMSEYHAAVGLAELDGWDDKRAAFRRVAADYRRAAAAHGVIVHAAPAIASNYVLVEATTAAHARAIRASLDREGLGNRQWYGEGLHREPHFRAAPRDELPEVERIAPRLIGVPVAQDLETDRIARIVATAAGA
jgi:dTDP-4-amino-4,6-dideoxygalactose transaminase